ncbi:MAG: hypothetical protein QME63_10490 [Actinomycetota bacterium]|nr:hypothetical protein [Actinomycetota bacterium]
MEGIYKKAQTLRQFPDIGYIYRSEKKEQSEYCYMVIIELHTCTRRKRTS